MKNHHSKLFKEFPKNFFHLPLVHFQNLKQFKVIFLIDPLNFLVIMMIFQNFKKELYPI